jgi:hypothetical protein
MWSVWEDIPAQLAQRLSLQYFLFLGPFFPNKIRNTKMASSKP